MAVGTITLTSETFLDGATSRANSRMVELLLSWVASSTDGSIPTYAITTYAGWWLTEIETNPGAVAPDAYDVTIVNGGGRDVLKGYGAARSATVTEVIDRDSFGDVQLGSDTHTLTFANQATVSAEGTVKIKLNR